MKQLLAQLALLALAACPVSAQTTQDFAARFMNEHADSQELNCVTIGPKMLARMLSINTDDQNGQRIKTLLNNVKSFRLITAGEQGSEYRKDALELLAKNKRRYAPYEEGAANGETCVWIRKRGKQIVELVFVEPDENDDFMILNITGEISDEFVDVLTQ